MPRTPDYNKYAIVMDYLEDHPKATQRVIMKACKCGPHLIPKARKWHEEGRKLTVKVADTYDFTDDIDIDTLDVDIEKKYNDINIAEKYNIVTVTSQPLGKIEIMELLIESGKASPIPEYRRISKILTVEDNNRNFQRRIIQDVIDMELGLLTMWRAAA